MDAVLSIQYSTTDILFYASIQCCRILKRNKQTGQKLLYHIYSAIRMSFPLSRMTTNNYISPMKSCYEVLP